MSSYSTSFLFQQLAVKSTAAASSINTTTSPPLPKKEPTVEEPMEEEEGEAEDDDSFGRTEDRWIFSTSQLTNTPSRNAGISFGKELLHRQDAASFIQDIGGRLRVKQLCINTGIVYMHRFFMFHPLTVYPPKTIETACIYLACKVEEQPVSVDRIVKASLYVVGEKAPDIVSKEYKNLAAELVENESTLIQTLGFDFGVEHPHSEVVKLCQIIRASNDLAQRCYFMATVSLHMTTMCLEYRPTVVACVCMNVASQRCEQKIPKSKDGKDWIWFVDKALTPEELTQYSTQFLAAYEKAPTNLKQRIYNLNSATRSVSENSSCSNSPRCPDSSKRESETHRVSRQFVFNMP